MTTKVIRNQILRVLYKAAGSYTSTEPTKVPGIKGEQGGANLNPMAAGERPARKGKDKAGCNATCGGSGMKTVRPIKGRGKLKKSELLRGTIFAMPVAFAEKAAFGGAGGVNQLAYSTPPRVPPMGGGGPRGGGPGGGAGGGSGLDLLPSMRDEGMRGLLDMSRDFKLPDVSPPELVMPQRQQSSPVDDIRKLFASEAAMRPSTQMQVGSPTTGRNAGNTAVRANHLQKNLASGVSPELAQSRMNRGTRPYAATAPYQMGGAAPRRVGPTQRGMPGMGGGMPGMGMPGASFGKQSAQALGVKLAMMQLGPQSQTLPFKTQRDKEKAQARLRQTI